MKKVILIFISGALVVFLSIGALLARTNPQDNSYNYLAIFSNIIHLVDSSYVEEVELNKVMDSALNGLVESLDPESFYIKKEELDEYKKELAKAKDETGAGLTIAKRFGMVVVVAVEKGSSADDSKIKPGDFIRSIDGIYVQQLPLYKIYHLLNGPSGSSVKVSIFKSALEKPEDYTLIRRAVTPPFTESYVAQNKIGYIHIKHLRPGIVEEMQKRLEALQRQQVDRLILDLRGCTDEDQDLSVAVANLFVGEVPILQISGRHSEVKKISGDSKTWFQGELLVLIDYTTAGGSEIIAGAIQDTDAGKAFGVRSFGRGGLRKLIPAGSNYVVLTTEKYLTPKGHSIMTNGIEPAIPFKDDVKTAERDPEVDRMLDKAIDYLRYEKKKAA